MVYTSGIDFIIVKGSQRGWTGWTIQTNRERVKIPRLPFDRRRIQERRSWLDYVATWRPGCLSCLCCQQSWSSTADLERVSISLVYFSLHVNGRYRKSKNTGNWITTSTMSSTLQMILKITREAELKSFTFVNVIKKFTSTVPYYVWCIENVHEFCMLCFSF